jgi:hypothetical protein
VYSTINLQGNNQIVIGSVVEKHLLVLYYCDNNIQK